MMSLGTSILVPLRLYFGIPDLSAALSKPKRLVKEAEYTVARTMKFIWYQ